MSLPGVPLSSSVWVIDEDVVYDGPFRTNVSAFLGHFGTKMHMDCSLASCWIVRVQERAGDEHGPVELHVYEEVVQQDSPSVCDQCRIIGWQPHPVCTRRYHFIIPTEPSASPLALSTSQGGPCNLPPALLEPEDDPHSLLYTAPVSIFDSKAHLLHGVLHLNGYGHLLRINGLEGGSAKLTGRQIMGMWDKLCALLRARKISVEDVSNKGGMELRVLHAAAHRTTWYGRWGYAFGRGAFNIVRKHWRQAVEAVHSVPLSLIAADFKAHTQNTAILHIIERYQALTMGRSGQATLGSFLQQLLLCLSQPDAAAWVLGLPDSPPPAATVKGAAARGSRAATQSVGRKRGRDAVDIPASAAAASTDAFVAAEPHEHESGAQSPCQGPADMAATAEAEPHEEVAVAEPTPTPAMALETEQPPVLPAVAGELCKQGEAGKASASGRVDVDDGRQPTCGQNHERRQLVKKAKGDVRKKERGALELLAERSKLRPLQIDKLLYQMPQDEVQDCLAIMIAILKEHSGMWMRRAVLRSLVMEQGKDAALVDSLLKAVADSFKGEFAIFRQVDPRTKTMYFLGAPAAGEDSMYPMDHRQPAAVSQAQTRKQQLAPAVAGEPDGCEAAGTHKRAEVHRPSNASPQGQSLAEAFGQPTARDVQQGSEHAAVDLPRDRPSSSAQPSGDGLAQQDGQPVSTQPSVVTLHQPKLSKGPTELPALRGELQAFELPDLPKSWTPGQIADCLDFIVTKLQEDTGIWIRRTVLRAMAGQRDKPAAIIDFLLKHLANRTTRGVAVFRQFYPQVNVIYYMAGPITGADGIMYPVDLRQPADILKGPVLAPPPARPAIPAAPLVQPDMTAGAPATAAKPARPKGTGVSQQGMQRAVLDAAATALAPCKEKAGFGVGVRQSGAPEPADSQSPAEAADPSELPQTQPATTESAGKGQGNADVGPDSESRGDVRASAATTGRQGRDDPSPEHEMAKRPEVSTVMNVSHSRLGDAADPGTGGERVAAQLVSAAEAAPRSPCGHDDVLQSLAADEPTVTAVIGAAVDEPQSGKSSGSLVTEPHMHGGNPADSALHVTEGSSPSGRDPPEQAECAAESAQAAHVCAASSPQIDLPGMSGSLSCMDDQQAGQPDDQLKSIQAIAATEFQADKLALNLLAKIPRRAPNGRFLTMAMRKSLAAKLALDHLASRQTIADHGKGNPAAGCGGGASLRVAEPSRQQLDSDTEPCKAQQLEVDMAPLQPTAAPDGHTEGSAQHSMPCTDLMVVLDPPGEGSQIQTGQIDVSSANAADHLPAVNKAQGSHRVLRHSAKSTGRDVLAANGIHGLEVSLAGNAADSVSTPSMKGKRTHKGKPAAVVPKGSGLQEMKPSAAHSTGNLPKASQPAGPWGTKAIRSIRNGATPVKSPAANAWRSAQLQDATVKAEEPTATKPDSTVEVAQIGSLLSSAADAKPLDGQVISPAEHSSQEAHVAKAGQNPPTNTASEPAADVSGTGAVTGAPEAAQVAGGQLRRKRALSGRLLTSLDGSGAVPSESAPQAGVSGPSKAKRKRSNGGTGQKRQRAKRSAPVAPGASDNAEPPSKPWQRLQPGAAFSPEEGVLPRDQVMCDLVHFFNAVLRLYEPAAAAGLLPPGLAPVPAAEAPGVSPRKQSRPSTVLEAPRLAADVAILRDTRHFVKDYQGNTLAPGASEQSPGSSAVRLLCQMEALDFTTLGQPSAQAAPAGPGKPNKDSAPAKHARGKLVKRLRVVVAPPELVIVTPRTTLKQLRMAAQKAFRDVYKMFEHVEILTVEGLNTPEAMKGRVGACPEGTTVTLHGQGADQRTCWHHAGGEEDWLVSCSCGTKDDDGERMVACDSCGLWMHLRCQGVPDSAPLPDEFVCARCSKKGYKTKVQK